MGVGFPRVTKCCFCISLRIACLIIGYISVVISCVSLSAICFYTYRVSVFVKHSEAHPDPEHPVEEVRRKSISLYLWFAYFMMVFLYNLVINIMLLVGVHRNNVKYMKYYVNSAYLLLALAITLVIIACVYMGLVAAIGMLKWAVTIVFCIIVVRSAYMEMEERNSPKTFEMHNLYTPQQAPLIV